MKRLAATSTGIVSPPGTWFAVALWILFLLSAPADAKLKQLDVFRGYDGVVPEGNWFPMAIEVLNDGPSFEAVFEVIPSQFSRGQARRMRVELPTGTRKRFVIPVFNSTRGNASWDLVVRDRQGAVRDQVRDIQPSRIVPMPTQILGALPRNVGGMPTFAPVDRNYAGAQPLSIRLQAELFPDTPIALNGLSSLYLNAEAAQNLKEPQVKALLGWLSAGGHLIVGLHQPSDLQASAWLRDLVPFAPASMAASDCPARLKAWLSESSKRLFTMDNVQTFQTGFRNLRPDPEFTGATAQVVTGKVRDGKVILASGELPLAIAAPRGRGTITVLTFGPELEPFRSWQHRGFFWAKLCDVPGEWYLSSRQPNYNEHSGWNVDSIYGSLVDSRQVRKLPVGWLLLLLMAYLAVIGPVDYFVLKKLNRQMLTWITFPSYVLLFSGLIYFIGYKLRAGDIEWNECHVVDVLPSASGAALHGTTFGSVYSPANASYPLAASQTYAALREEYAGAYGGGLESGRSFIEQKGNSFAAEISVPVWTSQMFVSDWWNSSPTAPLSAEVSRDGASYVIKVKNNLAYPLAHVCLIVEERMQTVEDLPAGAARSYTLNNRSGMELTAWLNQYLDRFYTAASSRRSALGDNSHSLPSRQELPDWAKAASFINSARSEQGYRQFQAPRSFDLSRFAQRGDLVVLGWVNQQLLVPPMNDKQFTPRRSQFDTLLRLVVPLKEP